MGKRYMYAFDKDSCPATNNIVTLDQCKVCKHFAGVEMCFGYVGALCEYISNTQNDKADE